jgi:hypothetical protein
VGDSRGSIRNLAQVLRHSLVLASGDVVTAERLLLVYKWNFRQEQRGQHNLARV